MSASRFGVPVALLCAAMVLWTRAALAQAPPAPGPTQVDGPIVLGFERCDEHWSTTVRQLVSIELGARLLEPQIHDSGPEVAATRAQLRCDESEATLTVTRAEPLPPLVLAVDLRRTAPEARPRLVALALSELVVTSRMGTPPTPAPAAAAPAAPAATPTAEPARLGWTPSLAAELVRQGEPPMAAPALVLGLHGAYGTRLRFGAFADLRSDWGATAVAGAEVKMYALSAALGPVLRFGPHGWSLFAGAGVRFGYARLQGEPSAATADSAAVAGAWVGPTAHAGVDLRLAGALALRVAFDFSYVATPVRGLSPSGAPVYAFEGPMLGALAGLALWP